MTYHWTELLPGDEYIVRTNGVLQDLDRKVLTLLYQPLIGQASYTLYMTLWSEVEINRLWGKESTHYHLMSMMQLNLNEIFEERKKLEGIGLLKTYLKETEEGRTFIYELQPPLSPEQYFNDGVLNIFLYNRLGKPTFKKVSSFFKDQKMEETIYKDVTRSFDAVFSSLTTSEFKLSNEEMITVFPNNDKEQMIEKGYSAGIFISENIFDFNLFFAGISEALMPKSAVNEEVKEMIAKLAYIYSIDPIEMKKVVMWALDENDKIDIELLRKSARDYYQINHGGELPNLVYKTQSLQHLSLLDKDSINEDDEQLIKKFDRISPHQLLVEISEGVEPTAADLQIIENVMMNQKLNPGVVNVLIHYAMLRTDLKLSKNYIERIAGHWVRKKVKTTKEAMDLAKAEHRKYQEWAEKSQQKEKQKALGNQSKNKWSPDAKRRQLMLGIDESENNSQKTTTDGTEEERQKRMQKMFDLIEGKEE